jgi:hypothetical protein
MARNGSGTISIINSFSANTTIESAKVNANFSDVASEITGSLPRDGQAAMTGQFKAADGTSGAPGWSWSSDPDCGIYRSASNIMAIAGTLTTNGTNKVDAFPAGTALLFQQTAAPTGWTKSTTHNDKALRVVSGTASSGGTTAFTSVFTSRTIAEANLPSHTHAVGTLATSSSGAHTHTYTSPPGEFGVSTGGTTAPRGNNFTDTTSSSGAHTHTITGATAATGSGTALDFAVQYVDVVICTKDA